MKKLIYILLLSLFLTILLSSEKNEEGIYMYKNNPQRTGYYDTYGPDKTPVVKWKIDLKKKLKDKEIHIKFQPLIYKNNLYLTTWGEYEYIISININNGKINWFKKFDTHKTGFIARSSIIFNDNIILTYQTEIKSININNKKEIWTYKIEGAVPLDSPIILSEPVLGDGVIYIGINDWRNIPDDAEEGLATTYLLAIDSETGKKLWKLKLQDGGISDLAYDKGYLYFSVYNRSYCMDVKTKKFKWITGNKIFYEKSIITEDKQIIWNENYYFIKALDKETGKLLWERKFEGGVIREVSYHNGKLYFGVKRNGRNSKLYVLDSKTGKILKEYNFNEYVYKNGPFITRNIFLMASYIKMYAYDINSNNLLWSWSEKIFLDEKDTISSYPIIKDGRIYFYTWAQKIYCLEEKK